MSFDDFNYKSFNRAIFDLKMILEESLDESEELLNEQDKLD